MGRMMFKNQSRFKTLDPAQREAESVRAALLAQIQTATDALTQWTLGRYGGAANTTIASTGADGSLTWTFPKPFSKPPTVALTVQDATANRVHACRITALSASAVSIQVDRYTPVVVLGVNVLSLVAPGAVTVHIVAKESA
jgi:hypothetical protein